MAENESDPADHEREDRPPADDNGLSNATDYELTAKDAGWRTPTFLITPAKLVFFDPPRPKRRR